ncbi:hypothetical protein EV356DRAFT_364740 [Viridothelium virens]|uniref:Tctex-1 n=1 Tax=Viridothelium virens TaxID=1048519 RepID=A0A6A6GXA5_VIRVR|nr:hypothetical protein EV356DRAFT_364740 [Viridothelium virens]
MSESPVSTTRLKQIATDACDSALGTVEGYSHSRTSEWNETIINKILQSLISETSSNGNPPTFKYAVNSTIIQHLSDPRPQPISTSNASTQGTEGSTAENETPSETPSGTVTSGQKVGRRGMHSATGAFWNNEKDGMWSFKYDGGEKKGMDVVVCVLWIAV